jgi:hypothetical protein
MANFTETDCEAALTFADLQQLESYHRVPVHGRRLNCNTTDFTVKTCINDRIFIDLHRTGHGSVIGQHVELIGSIDSEGTITKGKLIRGQCIYVRLSGDNYAKLPGYIT